ncbi:MAG TPA: YHS domain-containing protein [Tepidisphaeraceae bacterium]|nr:YHS domain-containing protein [Tepidisphaeraceae bacterium]
MKNLLLTVAVLVLSGTATLLAGEQAPATQPSGEVANKYCPIEPENKVDPKGATVMYEGKKVAFCCDHCIDEFNKDPQKYAANMK